MMYFTIQNYHTSNLNLFIAGSSVRDRVRVSLVPAGPARPLPRGQSGLRGHQDVLVAGPHGGKDGTLRTQSCRRHVTWGLGRFAKEIPNISNVIAREFLKNLVVFGNIGILDFVCT